MEYAAHISSARWRDSAARAAEFEAAGHRCRICNREGTAGNPLEAHHRTYQNLGRERAEDLTALCRECHRDVTAILRARYYESLMPMRADVPMLRDARVLASDPTAGSL
jgi:5-methylcytosine-specific restriction endonuclease McrA